MIGNGVAAAFALVTLAPLARAGDLPHPTNSCAQCHITHAAPGMNLTTVGGNANLCFTCHAPGGTAQNKAFANVNAANPWPGLPPGVSPSGNSHQWNGGLMGRVSFAGGAAVASSGTVSSAGVYTGAYQKAYTITITSNGNAGVALFRWSATSPGGGATNIATAASVDLNDGLIAVFADDTNAPVSFRSGDVWRIFVKPDLSMPSNAMLRFGMTNGLMCSSCHNEHSQLAEPFDAVAPAYTPGGGAGRHYLQMSNDTEQMCFECHASRYVNDSALGSHPVGIAPVTSGFYRVATNLPYGKNDGKMRCLTCHQMHFAATSDGSLLRVTNRNTLCTSCHTHADTTSPGTHLNTTNNRVLWPGGQYGSTLPARTNRFERGTCINCHHPHGWPDTLNPTNHYPTLLADREENVCFTCHDGNGPSQYNLSAVFNKATRHPVSRTNLHSAAEGGDTNAFGVANRHAECVDCHNPHVVKHGYGSETQLSPLMLGVSRIAVANGAAGTKPAYTFIPAGSTNIAGAREYEVCFKCHSGWTTLPANAPDLSIVFNPANESFHPVEGPGRNTSSYMSNSLAGGTGLPHLDVTSVVTCADCHNNDQIPLTVSLASTYTGSIVRGPHGAVSNALSSGAILRGTYKLAPTPNNPTTANFTLCFICHAASPFATSSTTTNSITRFNWHGKHMTDIGGACVDCHSDMHGNKLATVAGNRNYSRLVSFGPAVTGSRVWNLTAGGGNCALVCHGVTHSTGSHTYP